MFQVTLNLVLDRVLLKDVLKALLSTILFHRLFACIRPLLPPREILDITYSSPDDPVLDAQIDSQIARLVALLDTSSPPSPHTQQQDQQQIEKRQLQQQLQLQQLQQQPVRRSGYSLADSSIISQEHSPVYSSESAPQQTSGFTSSLPSSRVPESNSTTALQEYAREASGGSEQHITVAAPPLTSLYLSPQTPLKTSSMFLAFYTTPMQLAAVSAAAKNRRGPSWFSKVAAVVSSEEETACWEKWILNLSIAFPRSESERARVKRSMEAQIQECVFRIVEIIEENKLHIPPITTADGEPFAWKMGAVGAHQDSEETWGQVFKKMLVE